jgi:RNA polymerase sigma-54 factor
MKPTLQLKVSQHLTLTPQLQQSIRLLQLSTLELNAEVDRMLQENPLLEKENEDDEGGDAPAAAAAPDAADARGPAEGETREAAGEDERPEEPLDAADVAERGVPASEVEFAEDGGGGGSDWGSASDPDDDEFHPQQAASSTLRDHLNAQLAMLHLPARDRQLVASLIDALDDDGFLSSPLEEIAEVFPEDAGVEVDELAIALRYLQGFDPTGVGARGIGECLLLQLRVLPPTTPYRDAAMRVADGHLELLAARDVTKLKRLLVCDEACVRGLRDLIRTLNPRPGSSFAKAEANYVVPDVVVRKFRNQWVASLNEAAMPKLRVNRIYADILARSRDASHQQLAAQLQEAKWLIRNVQQRFDTILRVAQAIVERQRRFFEHGEVAMRPMVLREIADMLGLHESTISRVTTQKYMLTPRGTFELKYFFGSHVATDTGGAASATAIRALIKQLIGAEDARSPLTDSKIADVLGEQGILVARRTVAKYRESLAIPPVNLRKSL